MPLEFTLCVISPKTFIVVMGMNTQRADEGIDNMWARENQAPLQHNQGPPFEDVSMGDQGSVVPPSMTDGDIGEAFFNLSQSMTSHANVVTSEVQAMTTQVNQEVGPCVPYHASTMESR